MVTKSDFPTVEEFQKLKGMGKTHLFLYGFLLENLESGILLEVLLNQIEIPQGNLSRRLREMRTHFEIEHVTGVGYFLKKTKTSLNLEPVNARVRFKVLSLGRCATCGRSPKYEKVILEVDHIIPRDRGGSNEESNLQPLCKECNQGKKNFEYIQSVEPLPRYT